MKDVAELDGVRAAWDDLAVASGKPLSAPSWLIPWWHEMAPECAKPRVILVFEGADLVGVAPFYALRRGPMTSYRLFGTGMATRNAPLAAPGRERDVAVVIARTLARGRPRPGAVCFDEIDHDSEWPVLIAKAWPRRADIASRMNAPAPTLVVDGVEYDSWLAGKRRNFRKRVWRNARKLEEHGVRTRLVDDVSELDRLMEAFEELHGDRWGEASELNTESGRNLMLHAARDLMPSGRFRAVVLEHGDRVVSVDFLLAAGGEVVFWNGAWDAVWGDMSPSMHGMVFAIEDAMNRGDRRMDFGRGSHPYKLRLADGDAPISWPVLYPRTLNSVPARAVDVAMQGRKLAGSAVRRLPDRVRKPLERLRGRPSGGAFPEREAAARS